MQTEVARSAAAFVDSIGVNVHLSYWDGPYGKRFPEVADDLVKLGVKHVRDGVVLGQKKVCDEDRELAERGLRFTYITQPHLSAGDIGAWASCVGPAIEAFEGPNEYDISHPGDEPDWAATVRVFQQSLYASVKGNPKLRSLTVIGPSVTSGDAAAKVGDVAAYVDRGNTHDYFAGHEPETGGWGANGYGSIPFNLDIARKMSGAKPVEATETGYQTQGSGDAVNEDAQAAYLPRLFLQQFASGISRTFLYELLDEGAQPYGSFGLLRGDLTPKPAFVALESMIGLLGGGTSRHTGKLSFALDGATSDVRHVVLQQGDGHAILALWNGASIVVPKVGLPLPQRDVDVTLRLGGGARATRVLAYDSAQQLQARAATGTHVALHAGARVTFVEIATAR